MISYFQLVLLLYPLLHELFQANLDDFQKQHYLLLEKQLQVENKQPDIVSDEIKTRQFRIATYLIGLGLSDEAIAGFLGNWEVETTDFNPMKVQTPRNRSPYTYEEC